MNLVCRKRLLSQNSPVMTVRLTPHPWAEPLDEQTNFVSKWTLSWICASDTLDSTLFQECKETSLNSHFHHGTHSVTENLPTSASLKHSPAFSSRATTYFQQKMSSPTVCLRKILSVLNFHRNLFVSFMQRHNIMFLTLCTRMFLVGGPCTTSWFLFLNNFVLFWSPVHCRESRVWHALLCSKHLRLSHRIRTLDN